MADNIPTLITRDETQPALSIADPARARRRWMAVEAGLALLYALLVLVAAWTSADPGFYAHNGGPILAVADGGPADAAGLLAGDLIVELDGRALADPIARGDALRAIEPGSRIAVLVDRDGERFPAVLDVGRRVPMASIAAIFLAGILLFIAFLADRGGPGPLPRAFFRSSLVYVVFLAGAFSWEAVLQHLPLAIPWLYALMLAAPVTCHFMLKFPAGAVHQTRAQLALIYGPPVVLGTAMAVGQSIYELGFYNAYGPMLALVHGALAGLLAAVYLTTGAVARAVRLRRKRREIDPVAVRWLIVGSISVAAPLIAGALWALIDVREFIAGGFRPFVAVATVGGVASVVLAMTRVPLGELDRMWRRSSGHMVATALAAVLFFACIGLFGGAASVLSGGKFTAALAATLVAAVLFGPARARLQRVVDERFARDRSRARALLREAAESAATTLDIDSLVSGVVHRVQAALSADGAAIYAVDDGAWQRVACAGRVAIGEALAKKAPIARRLQGAVLSRSSRDLAAGIVGVPLLAEQRTYALVVAARDGRTLDDEDRELLTTIAAQLVVAVDNALAHTELRELNAKLQREYELAERRRREIARLKERVEEENRELLGRLAAREGKQPIVGGGLRTTFELVQKVARTESTVLVRGETGVGKELIARAIHIGSSRRDGPFVVVDCGAISPGVFESALFGHERGAFTGAVRSSPGAFRSAEGGTIFLDEIGELPPDLQPKLLRVLQERTVHPVGADHPVSVDVRVLSGTNRDLTAEVARGRFRQDLLYRLRVVEIEVPPLRQRSEDIPALAEHFLRSIAERTGRPLKQLAPDALQALLDHMWPGNVRELEHTLEAAAVYADGPEIHAADLPIFEQVFRERGKAALQEPGTGGLRETLEDLERNRLIEALREHNGNRTRTAKALGMSRGALLRRLARYDIADIAS